MVNAMVGTNVGRLDDPKLGSTVGSSVRRKIGSLVTYSIDGTSVGKRKGAGYKVGFSWLLVVG